MKSPATVALTEILSSEHEVIKRGVSVLGRLCAHLRLGGALDQEAVDSLLRFLREYADEHHHAKEEHILFPWVQANGFVRGAGPIEVMISDHIRARSHVSEMGAAMDRLRSSPADDEARKRFLQAGEAYAVLLWQHIWKEDNVLYPMADRLGTGTVGIYDPTEDPHRDVLAIDAEHRSIITRLEALAEDWPKPEIPLRQGLS